MADNLRRKIVRRLPGIGWRDARLAERESQVAELRRSLEAAQKSASRAQAKVDQNRAELRRLRNQWQRPSFRRDLEMMRRTLVDLRSVDPGLRHPQRHIPFKLRNYRLAMSHGIPTPTVRASWTEVADIELTDLPEQFVVKSDGGAGGHGVLPLRRVGADRFELLDGTRELTQDGVREHFASRNSLSGPFFAEEVLVQPGGGPIPDDVKIYAAYGSIIHVLLRRMPEHGNLGTALYRYLGPDEEDLGDVALGQKIDPTIPRPDGLTEMLRQARHLSRAVGLPFIRVDLYATDRGPVLGEMTRAPGGKQAYVPDHDEWMGSVWERARWELDLDLVAGRPAGVLHGTHPAPNPYPEGHISTLPDPGGWTVRTLPCEQWCGPAAATGRS